MAAATPSLDELLRQLSEAVCDELKIITYKWFARTHDLPANYAKQVLFRFVEEQQERVRAVYMIAGTLPAGAGEGADARSVVRLVDAQELSRARSALHTVTSLHVHSVMPAAPNPLTDATRLCFEDQEQARVLYAHVRQHNNGNTPGNCGDIDIIRRNACSAVRFVPEIRSRAARTAMTAMDKAAAGAAVKQQGGKSAAVPPPTGDLKLQQQVKKQKQQQQPQPQQEQQQQQQLCQNEAQPAPAEPSCTKAPVKLTQLDGPAGRSSGKENGGKSGEHAAGSGHGAVPKPGAGPNKRQSSSSLASLWAKAPSSNKSAAATKPGPAVGAAQQGAAAATAAPPARGEAAADSAEAQEAPPAPQTAARQAAGLGVSDNVQDMPDSMDDDAAVAAGGHRGRRGRAVLEDSDDDADGCGGDGTGDNGAAAVVEEPAAKRRRGRLLIDDDDDDDDACKDGRHASEEDVLAAMNAAAPAPAAGATAGDSGAAAVTKHTNKKTDSGRRGAGAAKQACKEAESEVMAAMGVTVAAKPRARKNSKAGVPPAAAAMAGGSGGKRKTGRGRGSAAAAPAAAGSDCSDGDDAPATETQPQLQPAAQKLAAAEATAQPQPAEPPATQQQPGGQVPPRAQGGPRIDPVTGEEVWGEDEPTPMPDLHTASGAKKPAFGTNKPGGGGSGGRASVGPTPKAKATTPAVKGASVKAGGATVPAAGSGGQKNITAFFGRR